MTRIELVTSSLPRKRSTPELHRPLVRAGDGIRIRDPQLGRLMLYQLSYSRLFLPATARIFPTAFYNPPIEWGEQDSNLRRHSPADLQSAPVGHFGISPTETYSFIEYFLE